MDSSWFPAYAESFTAGELLTKQGNFEAALAMYDVAININTQVGAAYVNAGWVLERLNRLQDALIYLNRAIEVQPNLVMAYNNRGALFRSLGQNEEAAIDYLKAIELDGNNAIDAHGNLATYYLETRQYDLAAIYYDKAIALRPDYALTRWNAGMCFLLLGDFERGWSEYHWRWKVESYQQAHRKMVQPMWMGHESLVGKTILLQAEQGFGDMIQFCRYATRVAALGARVLLEVHPELVELCRSLKGVSAVYSQKDELPEFDFYCPMMSLPLAFNLTVNDIPSSQSYLSADPLKVARWHARLGAKTKPRIGVVWSSDPQHQTSRLRSVPLQAFGTLLSDEFQFICLQCAIWESDRIAFESANISYFGTDLTDFSETAALCELMDLVISVDTSVLHLAGALGKPLYALLHSHNDWRWLLEREDSPWYPTAKLYRQETVFQWGGVLAAVDKDLRALLLA